MNERGGWCKKKHKLSTIGSKVPGFCGTWACSLGALSKGGILTFSSLPGLGHAERWGVNVLLMFCVAVLPLRPWWNYQAVKSVFRASSSLSALFSPCFVFDSLFCVHMHVYVCVHVSLLVLLSFPVPRMVPLTWGCPPIQSPHVVRVSFLFALNSELLLVFLLSPFILYFSEFLSPPKLIIIGYLLAVCPTRLQVS